jgi:hypothetical protein
MLITCCILRIAFLFDNFNSISGGHDFNGLRWRFDNAINEAIDRVASENGHNSSLPQSIVVFEKFVNNRIVYCDGSSGDGAMWGANHNGR